MIRNVSRLLIVMGTATTIAVAGHAGSSATASAAQRRGKPTGVAPRECVATADREANPETPCEAKILEATEAGADESNECVSRRRVYRRVARMSAADRQRMICGIGVRADCGVAKALSEVRAGILKGCGAE